METISKGELIGPGQRLTRDALERKKEEAAACPHARTLDKRAVSCSRLEELTGNTVAVGAGLCLACRQVESFDVAENEYLARLALAVAWSRFFPQHPRGELAAEAPGERDAVIETVKACRGSETAKRFVDTMFASGLFESAETAVDFLLRHELVEDDREGGST